MPELITSDQLAKLLGVDRSTVLRRVRRGELTPVYTGPGRTGVYLFDPAIVEQDDEIEADK